MKLTPDVLFGDHMVLQAGMPVELFGLADGEGEVILTVTDRDGNAQTFTGRAENGGFSVWTAAYPCGTGYTLTLGAEGDGITFTDVLFGEVWLLCGQSNMSWQLGWCWKKTTAELKYADEIASCADDMIREAAVWEVEQKEPIERLPSIRPWRPFAPETAPEISACGFFFARRLREKLKNVPIGILSSCRGAVMLSGWSRGGTWYNGMIAPITRVRARGIVWYQGEGDPFGYAQRLAAMVGDWRQQFRAPWMHFHVIELPRFVQEKTWFLCREEDRKVTTLTEKCTWSSNIDTGMYIPSIAEGDLGNTDAIHPYQKKEVGFRAADAVSEAVYGIGHYPIPHVDRAEKRDGKTVLHFADCADGLLLRGSFGFEAGEGDEMVPVTPTLRGEEIVLDGEYSHIRYGFWNIPGSLDPADSVCLFCRAGDETYPAAQFDLTV